MDSHTTNKFDWAPIVQIGIVTAIILGANLPFFFMHRSEMRAMENEMREFREKSDRESREFREQMIRIELKNH